MAQNLFNREIITDGDMSQASITSEWVDLSKVDTYMLTAKWIGSPVGEFKIQFALIESDPRDIPEAVIAIDGADDASFSEAVSNYDKVRAVYTRTSGSGTLTVRINGKGTES